MVVHFLALVQFRSFINDHYHQVGFVYIYLNPLYLEINLQIHLSIFLGPIVDCSHTDHMKRSIVT